MLRQVRQFIHSHLSLFAARKSFLCNSANLSFWCKATFASGSRKSPSLVRVCPVWCFSTPSGAGQWAPILSGSGLTLCYSIFMVFKILANQATKGRSAVYQHCSSLVLLDNLTCWWTTWGSQLQPLICSPSSIPSPIWRSYVNRRIERPPVSPFLRLLLFLLRPPPDWPLPIWLHLDSILILSNLSCHWVLRKQCLIFWKG